MDGRWKPVGVWYEYSTAVKPEIKCKCGQSEIPNISGQEITT